MRIEHITIENYRLFKHAELKNLPGMAVFVGANGAGKSTLFDVFGFLRDALKENVHVALGRRGGFKEVVSRGSDGPIRFEIKFREAGEGQPLVTYELAITYEAGRPIVQREVLKYRRGQHGKPWRFLDFTRGSGLAITNEADYTAGTTAVREEQRLESPDILAIKGLGQFQRFKVVAAFRRLIESWHLSDFHIAEARPSQEMGYAEHLSSKGDNLPLVAQYLYQQHREAFNEVLRRMARRVPGVTSVDAAETVDGRVVLRFQDGAFHDPFVSRYVSDGTIKMFAYLILLHDPAPHPLLCIEEPENQLYPTLLDELAEEFRDYSIRGGQVLISTHSPDLLNGVKLEEIYWLRKRQGFTTVARASDSELLRSLVAEGDLPGALWKQGLFEGVNP
jgi:predicted ATPase